MIAMMRRLEEKEGLNNDTDELVVEWEMIESTDKWVTAKGKATFL